MSNEIYIWAQNTIRAGERAYPRYDRELPEASDDYVRYAGSDNEIRKNIAALVAGSKTAGAGSDLYMRRVSRILSDAIGDPDPFDSEDDEAALECDAL